MEVLLEIANKKGPSTTDMTSHHLVPMREKQHAEDFK